MFSYSYRDDQDKPILLLQIGLAEGRGDWVHGLEIARYIKENFGNNYRIAAFIFPDRTGISGSSEAKPYIDDFKKKFANKDNQYELKDNDFFDCLYDGYELGREAIVKAYKDFIEQNQNISAELIVSYLRACIIDNIKDLNKRFNTILVPEYGAANHYDYIYRRNIGSKVNLAMGFGEKCNGIRIYSSDQEANYYEELKKQNIDLYNKLFINSDNYEAYHQSRKLLPGDLRNLWALLNFIKINVISYGGKCDFYLPNKYLEKEYVDIGWSSMIFRNMLTKRFAEKNILECKEEDRLRFESDSKSWEEERDRFNEIFNNPHKHSEEYLKATMLEYCKKYSIEFTDIYKPVHQIIEEFCLKCNVKCKFIYPNEHSSTEDANLSEDPNCVRIFTGFKLTDDLYKGLYLHNHSAGAGISGDDGWSLAISGNNLPFHGHINGEVQPQIFKDFIKLAQALKLTYLEKYLECISSRPYYMFDDSSGAIATNPPELLTLLTDKLPIVLQEYHVLTEHVKNDLNIFHKLHAQLELLRPHNRISIKG